MTKLKSLKPDPMNANIHSEYGTTLLENSIRDNGLGRSILISSDDVVIAGNGVFEGAGAVGIEKVRVIETDGNEVIAVKRKDIKSGTAKFYKMALADNIVAQKNIVMDVETVEAIVVEYPETITWGTIALPEEKQAGDQQKANRVIMKFEFSSKQYAEIKKGMKLAKQKFKDQFQKNENDDEQGQTLYFIMKEFLKANK